ncbi:MAG: LWR-salt protein [Halolamina sp.]
MNARYAFRIRVRFAPPAGVSVEPSTVEVRFYRRAADPGEEGWLFFRDNLWRGEVADEGHFRDLVADALGTEVDSVSFSALETDPEYLEALRDAIAADLDAFRADSVDEALTKYLGSSIEVRDSL